MAKKQKDFPMDTTRFLVDISGFNIEEVGVYTRLLITLWTNKELPVEPERLAAISQCSIEKFEQIWPTIKSKFVLNEDNKYINLKMEETRNKVDRKSFFTSLAGETSQETKRKKRETKPLEYPWTSEAFLQKWDFWKKYKKDTFRFTYKSHQSEQGILNSLKEMSEGNEQVGIKLIQNAIDKQWQGIYTDNKILNDHKKSRNGNNAGSKGFGSL